MTSIFLARLLGPPLLILGIGLLLNRVWYRAMVAQFTASRPLMFLFAVIGLVAGLAIVLVHNVWVLNWPVLITLLGWLNLIRGVLTVVFPEQSAAFAERVTASHMMPQVAGLVPLTVGLILVFFGYFR